MTPRLPARRRGMSLLEVLISITIFGVVFAGAINFVVAQSRSFRLLADRNNAVQSGRFGRDLLRTELRTAGTNVGDVQPIIVLANDSALAFNADLTTTNKDSVALTGAVYVDRYAEAGTTTAIRVSNAIAVPGSRPALTYPLQDYSQSPSVFINSDAELLSYWFAPDTTAGPGKYALYRRVNDAPPEVIATGISKATNRTFFRFFYDPSRYGVVNASLDTVPRGWLPLTKSVAQRGTGADTGTAITTRVDALRAVEVNYEVTPARGGTRETVRYVIPLPNVANARQSRACGRVPLAPSAPTVTWRADSSFVQLVIPKATDDGGGEKDVIRYVIWRQQNGATGWGEPITTVAANQAATYTIRDTGWPIRPASYRYALAVQDCTPNVSALAISAFVNVP
ncbi:MAG: prepilin-type N-terminal cleavage/methylation domain-containing protein [Gemmatimonadaceae bacterium]|nr:prepilin-type N-terminal cleavage/methylation domain-containing protein [Gemmatimonadaceae bacterium]